MQNGGAMMSLTDWETHRNAVQFLENAIKVHAVLA